MTALCRAGGNVVLHASANAQTTSSSTIRDRLPKPVGDFFATLGDSYRESENPLISMSRGVTNGLHRFFIEENETARVVRWMKTLDPDFQMEAFLRELREYIVPEVVDAFVSADIKTLKEWTSEAVSLSPLRFVLIRLNRFLGRHTMSSQQQFNRIYRKD